MPRRSLVLLGVALLLWLQPIIRDLIVESLLPHSVALALVAGTGMVVARQRLDGVKSFLIITILITLLIVGVDLWQEGHGVESALATLPAIVLGLAVACVQSLLAFLVALDIERRHWPVAAQAAAVVLLLFVMTPLIVAFAVYGQIILGGEWI
jgi:hypothetical protein